MKLASCQTGETFPSPKIEWLDEHKNVILSCYDGGKLDANDCFVDHSGTGAAKDNRFRRFKLYSFSVFKIFSVLRLTQVWEQKLTRAKSINAALFIKNWSTAKAKKRILIVTFQKRVVSPDHAPKRLLIFLLKLQIREVRKFKKLWAIENLRWWRQRRNAESSHRRRKTRSAWRYQRSWKWKQDVPCWKRYWNCYYRNNHCDNSDYCDYFPRQKEGPKRKWAKIYCKQTINLSKLRIF